MMKNSSPRIPMIASLAMALAAFLIIPLLVSCEFEPPKGSRDAQAMRGKEIFKMQCAPCHGMGDLAATVDTLKKPALDLTEIMKRRKASEFPIAEIARFIDGRLTVKEHGAREMPVWGEVYEAEGMNDTEIRGRKGELVAYLMSIQDRDF